MQQVVINKCYGGFSLSGKALRWLRDNGCANVTGDNDCLYYQPHGSRELRTDPLLIAVVRDMGRDAWGWGAELKIVEVPDDVEWTIEEYDGVEWVAEKHRIWE